MHDLTRYRVELREPLYWRHDGASVALNPPPAASGALIAFGLAYLETLAEHGRAIDALALRAAMEATNQARATHGEGLAQRLAGGALANELREAARHPPPIAARPMSASSTPMATPPRSACPTARATASSSANSASC